VLALAGLVRLGRGDAGGVIMSVEAMLPAPAQGAVCVESRVGDDRVTALLAAIDHEDTSRAIAAERALLKALDGSCRTPLGGLARLDGSGGLALDALVATNDGAKVWRVDRRGDEADAERIGGDAGQELRRLAGW